MTITTDQVTLNIIDGQPYISVRLSGRSKHTGGQLADGMKKLLQNGGELALDVKKHRKKRSLDANAYMWELCGKIAEVQGLSPEEVYRHHVREVGVYRDIEICADAVPTIAHSWGLNGIAWLTEQLDGSRTEGFVLVRLYYGSSTYNTRQMSRLLDNIVQDCKALGIETRTPDELANLKSLWGRAK